MERWSEPAMPAGVRGGASIMIAVGTAIRHLDGSSDLQ
jgi:hypothetical protein